MLLLRVGVRNNRFQTAAVFAADGEEDTCSLDEMSSAQYDNPSFRIESNTSENLGISSRSVFVSHYPLDYQNLFSGG